MHGVTGARGVRTRDSSEPTHVQLCEILENLAARFSDESGPYHCRAGATRQMLVEGTREAEAGRDAPVRTAFRWDPPPVSETWTTIRMSGASAVNCPLPLDG